jgi:3-oxoacyl-[acyl-carrier-protein] synthase II
MNGRRVVVTGLGAVTSLGCHATTIFDQLLQGRSGISLIQGFDTTEFPVKIGAEARCFDPKEC